MASMLANGAQRESEKYNGFILNEALMNQFGAIVTTGLLIGDINQLSYID